MPILIIVGGVVLLYLLSQQGGVQAGVTLPSGATTTGYIAPYGAPAPGYGTPLSSAYPAGRYSGTGVGVGATAQPTSIAPITGAAASAASGFASAAASTGAISGLAATGIGAGVAVGLAIFTALWNAHEQRKKEAQNENQAMNAGVQGWDQAVRTVNAAYNNGQADPATCIQALQQIMSNYWAEVSPYIQPGRNGCNSGTGCPPYAGCSGSIGAACCVGCYDLVGGSTPHVFNAFDGGDGVTPFLFGIDGSIAAIQMGGAQVCYQGVVGSSYGGQTRNGYRLTWRRIASA